MAPHASCLCVLHCSRLIIWKFIIMISASRSRRAPRRTSSLLLLPLVALVALVFLPVRANAACRRLIEADNAVATYFIPSITNTSKSPSSTQASFVSPEVRQQFRTLDARFPWLSQCLASVNYWELFVSLAKNDKAVQCWRKIYRSTPPQELYNEYFREYYCPLYLNATLPCVNEVLIPAIQTTIGSTSDNCCEPMKQQLSEMLGLDWAVFVDLALKHFGNIVCSQKSFFKSDRSQFVTQSCGYALTTSFLSENILDTILTAFQISNTQGCRAMSGSRFYTNQAMTAQLFADDGEEPLGVCFAPIDALIQQVSKLPLFKTMVLRSSSSQLAMHFSSLFGAGRCLRGSLLTGWLLSESEFVMVAARLIDTAMAMVNSFEATPEWRQALSILNVSHGPDELKQQASLARAIRRVLVNLDTRLRLLCFHLPNSFSCTYSGGTLTRPFPQIGTGGATSQSLIANTTGVASIAATKVASKVSVALRLGFMAWLWVI